MAVSSSVDIYPLKRIFIAYPCNSSVFEDRLTYYFKGVHFMTSDKYGGGKGQEEGHHVKGAQAHRGL